MTLAGTLISYLADSNDDTGAEIVAGLKAAIATANLADVNLDLITGGTGNVLEVTRDSGTHDGLFTATKMTVTPSGSGSQDATASLLSKKITIGQIYNNGDTWTVTVKDSGGSTIGNGSYTVGLSESTSNIAAQLAASLRGDSAVNAAFHVAQDGPNIAVTRLTDPGSTFTVQISVAPEITTTAVDGLKVSFNRAVDTGDVWTVALKDNGSLIQEWNLTVDTNPNADVDTVAEIAAYFASQINSHANFTASAAGTDVLIAALNNPTSLTAEVSIDPEITTIGLAITDLTVAAADFDAAATYAVTIGDNSVASGIAAGADVSELRNNLVSAIEGHADYSAGPTTTGIRIIKVVDGTAMGTVQVTKTVVFTDFNSVSATTVTQGQDTTYEGSIDFASYASGELYTVSGSIGGKTVVGTHQSATATESDILSALVSSFNADASDKSASISASGSPLGNPTSLNLESTASTFTFSAILILIGPRPQRWRRR